ncbi:hypothetical protein [Algoriphagus zhangzhouensis]|uniref:Uncharacterized protein n=1 Tax=Algoriphagus zhangzhouensis TaxID=1073327 RepID=A0A1M7ZHM7_9BACT|nr:hypothetical protein [Algoriphagus zhangzhouensis]TDY44217.1 hypothetical protein A8938_3429 [Algoriphagus zhangzhouensis]SHO64398.1 hypothetical protein SAMN04488108_3425 [Algoriphagus zhangzhouensis]
MKNSIKYLLVILFSFGLLFNIESVYAQEKVDIVVMRNGENREVKVTGITETIVKFRYIGEDFDYEIPKTDISQIKFASGRIQSFEENVSDLPTDGTHAGSSAERHNKIAVLPFAIISNDPGLTIDELRTFTQNQAANTVRNEYGSLSLQDPLTTNAILAKNNLSQDNIDSFTPAEIAELLGVEFIIFGSVKVTNKGATTYTSGSSTYSQKTDKNSDTKRNKGSVFSSSSSSTNIEYDTMVDLRMFNDRGDNLYSNSRHAFGTGTDAYKGSVDYMLKRTPFGSKYGKK